MKIEHIAIWTKDLESMKEFYLKIAELLKNAGSNIGLAHFAISLGSKQKVDFLTNQFRQDDLEIVGEPRTTGDGYYESVIRDIEGNVIELTI